MEKIWFIVTLGATGSWTLTNKLWPCLTAGQFPSSWSRMVGMTTTSSILIRAVFLQAIFFSVNSDPAPDVFTAHLLTDISDSPITVQVGVSHIIFRCASISSTYPCLSVRWSVGRSHFLSFLSFSSIFSLFLQLSQFFLNSLSFTSTFSTFPPGDDRKIEQLRLSWYWWMARLHPLLCEKVGSKK